jgi:hypothetical protein
MPSVPSITLENVMACCVHQAVKLGLIQDLQTTELEFDFQTNSSPNRIGHKLPIKQLTLDKAHSKQVNIDIT